MCTPSPPPHRHPAPGVPTQRREHQGSPWDAWSWFHPPNLKCFCRRSSEGRGAAGGCSSTPARPRQTPKRLPVGREGPSQAAEGRGRNVNGKQVLPTDGFAVPSQPWERGPDMGVCRGVTGGAGRPLRVLKDRRKHRSTRGETEAQPSEGVHAAHKGPCPVPIPMPGCWSAG